MSSVFVCCLWFACEFSKSVKCYVGEHLWMLVRLYTMGCLCTSHGRFAIGIEGQYSGEFPILCWVGLLQIQDNQESSDDQRSNRGIELIELKLHSTRSNSDIRPLLYN